MTRLTSQSCSCTIFAMKALFSAGFRVQIKTVGLTALLSALALGVLAVGPPSTIGEPASETRKKHELFWWESSRASQSTPEAQLAYADALREEGRLIFASKQYRALTYTWPQSPEAPQAQYRFAQLLEERGKDKYAFEEYQYLLEAYAGFVPYEEVLDHQYGIADRLATETRYFLFFSYQSPEDAIPFFETLIQNGPQWKRSPKIQFRIARIYEKKEQYDLAMDTYALYQQKYPVSRLAEQAAFGHGECAYEYALDNPNAVDLRQNAEAILLSFLARYPRSDMAAVARTHLNELQLAQATSLYRQAVIYDRRSEGDLRGKKNMAVLNAARISFQRVIDEYPLSPLAKTARADISRINKRKESYHENK